MATHWPGPDPDAAAGASVGGCVWGRDPLDAGAGAEAIAVEGAAVTEKNRLTVGCRVGNGDGTPGAVPQKQPLPQVWKKPHCWGNAGSAGQLVRHGMNRGPLGADVVRTRGRCCMGALLPVVLELAVGADVTRDADGRSVGLGREVGGWVGAGLLPMLRPSSSSLLVGRRETGTRDGRHEGRLVSVFCGLALGLGAALGLCVVLGLIGLGTALSLGLGADLGLIGLGTALGLGVDLGLIGLGTALSLGLGVDLGLTMGLVAGLGWVLGRGLHDLSLFSQTPC